MREGVAAAEEGSRFSLLSTHLQGVAALGGSFPFRPLSAQGFYPPPGKVPPVRRLAPPERGSGCAHGRAARSVRRRSALKLQGLTEWFLLEQSF